MKDVSQLFQNMQNSFEVVQCTLLNKLVSLGPLCFQNVGRAKIMEGMLSFRNVGEETGASGFSPCPFASPFTGTIWIEYRLTLPDCVCVGLFHVHLFVLSFLRR